MVELTPKQVKLLQLQTSVLKESTRIVNDLMRDELGDEEVVKNIKAQAVFWDIVKSMFLRTALPARGAMRAIEPAAPMGVPTFGKKRGRNERRPLLIKGDRKTPKSEVDYGDGLEGSDVDNTL